MKEVRFTERHRTVCVCVAGGVGVRGSCPVVRVKATDFYKLIGQ